MTCPKVTNRPQDEPSCAASTTKAKAIPTEWRKLHVRQAKAISTERKNPEKTIHFGKVPSRRKSYRQKRSTMALRKTPQSLSGTQDPIDRCHFFFMFRHFWVGFFLLYFDCPNPSCLSHVNVFLWSEHVHVASKRRLYHLSPILLFSFLTELDCPCAKSGW